MKEMVKRLREEKGGFTLAELLIVVAIILVLVAIAIPVFTGALNNANQAVLRADERAARAQASTEYLLNGRSGTWAYSYTVSNDGEIDLGTPTQGGGPAGPTQDGTTNVVTGTVVISADDLTAVTTPDPDPNA